MALAPFPIQNIGSTLGSAFTQSMGLLNVGSYASDAFKELTNSQENYLRSISKFTTEMKTQELGMRAAGVAIEKFSRTFLDQSKNVARGANAINESMFKLLGNNAKFFASTMADMAGKTSLLAKSITGVAGAFKILSGPVGWGLIAFQGLSTAIEKVTSDYDKLIAKQKEVAKSFEATYRGAINATGGTRGALGIALGGAIAQNVSRPTFLSGMAQGAGRGLTVEEAARIYHMSNVSASLSGRAFEQVLADNFQKIAIHFIGKSQQEREKFLRETTLREGAIYPTGMGPQTALSEAYYGVGRNVSTQMGIYGRRWDMLKRLGAGPAARNEPNLSFIQSLLYQSGLQQFGTEMYRQLWTTPGAGPVSGFLGGGINAVAGPIIASLQAIQRNRLNSEYTSYYRRFRGNIGLVREGAPGAEEANANLLRGMAGSTAALFGSELPGIGERIGAVEARRRNLETFGTFYEKFGDIGDVRRQSGEATEKAAIALERVRGATGLEQIKKANEEYAKALDEVKKQGRILNEYEDIKKKVGLGQIAAWEDQLKNIAPKDRARWIEARKRAEGGRRFGETKETYAARQYSQYLTELGEVRPELPMTAFETLESKPSAVLHREAVKLATEEAATLQQLKKLKEIEKGRGRLTPEELIERKKLEGQLTTAQGKLYSSQIDVTNPKYKEYQQESDKLNRMKEVQAAGLTAVNDADLRAQERKVQLLEKQVTITKNLLEVAGQKVEQEIRIVKLQALPAKTKYQEAIGKTIAGNIISAGWATTEEVAKIKEAMSGDMGPVELARLQTWVETAQMGKMSRDMVKEAQFADISRKVDIKTIFPAMISAGQRRGYVSPQEAKFYSKFMGPDQDIERKHIDIILKMKKEAMEREIEFTVNYTKARMNIIKEHYEQVIELDKTRLYGADRRLQPAIQYGGAIAGSYQTGVQAQMGRYAGEDYWRQQYRSERDMIEGQQAGTLGMFGVQIPWPIQFLRQQRRYREQRQDFYRARARQQESDMAQIGGVQNTLGDLGRLNVSQSELMGTEGGRQMLLQMYMGSQAAYSRRGVNVEPRIQNILRQQRAFEAQKYTATLRERQVGARSMEEQIRVMQQGIGGATTKEARDRIGMELAGKYKEAAQFYGSIGDLGKQAEYQKKYMEEFSKLPAEMKKIYDDQMKIANAELFKHTELLRIIAGQKEGEGGGKGKTGGGEKTKTAGGTASGVRSAAGGGLQGTESYGNIGAGGPGMTVIPYNPNSPLSSKLDRWTESANPELRGYSLAQGDIFGAEFAGKMAAYDYKRGSYPRGISSEKRNKLFPFARFSDEEFAAIKGNFLGSPGYRGRTKQDLQEQEYNWQAWDDVTAEQQRNLDLSRANDIAASKGYKRIQHLGGGNGIYGWGGPSPSMYVNAAGETLTARQLVGRYGYERTERQSEDYGAKIYAKMKGLEIDGPAEGWGGGMRFKKLNEAGEYDYESVSSEGLKLLSNTRRDLERRGYATPLDSGITTSPDNQMAGTASSPTSEFGGHVKEFGQIIKNGVPVNIKVTTNGQTTSVTASGGNTNYGIA